MIALSPGQVNQPGSSPGRKEIPPKSHLEFHLFGGSELRLAHKSTGKALSRPGEESPNRENSTDSLFSTPRIGGDQPNGNWT